QKERRRDRVSGHPNGNCWQTGGNRVRYFAPLRQHEGKWSRPERRGESVRRRRPLGGDTARGCGVSDVNDDRVVRWPPLRPIDALDRRGGECVSAKAVHGLGGKGN